MSVPLPVRRLLLVLAIAAAGVAAGLVDMQWIDLWLVDPARAVDSESALARGFPHAWWVVHPQPGLPSPTSSRIVARNLLQSAFFWLACSSVAVGAGTFAVRAVRRVKARRSGDTTGVRAFAALATGACAAGYAEMFTGFFGFWSLAAATWIALLLPLVLIRSRADLRRRWLSIVLFLLLLASVLAPALASEDLVGFVLIVGIFLALTLVVALLFLYALTAPIAPVPIPPEPPTIARPPDPAPRPAG
jgi:hypothetical protein